MRDIHYIVENGVIIPIDYENTGVEQTDMKWMYGLQQFLQIKEGLVISSENIVTNFISNWGYVKNYKNFVGVTGSLGDEHTTRNFLY